jgi:hypothetical protein
MEAFVTEAFTLLGVGLLCISLRTYARVSSVGFKGLQADDYLMWLAAVILSSSSYDTKLSLTYITIGCLLCGNSVGILSRGVLAWYDQRLPWAYHLLRLTAFPFTRIGQQRYDRRAAGSLRPKEPGVYASVRALSFSDRLSGD